MDYSDNDLVPSCDECGGPLNDDNHHVDDFVTFGDRTFTVVICQKTPTLFTQ